MLANDSDTLSSGTSPLLRYMCMAPLSSVSTMKSGVICCILRPSASPRAAPGLGLSLRSCSRKRRICASVRWRADFMPSQFFFMNMAKRLLRMSCVTSRASLSGIRESCMSRHCCSDCAPMPGGSNVWSCESMALTSLGEHSMLWYTSSSSQMACMSLRRSPSSSRLPMMYSSMYRCRSSMSSSPTCSRSLS